MRRLLPALFVLLLTGCQSTFFATLNAGRPPEPVETARYGEHRLQTLDVYRPRPGSGPAPVVVFFYGGRWQGGTRREYAFVGERLAAEGLLVVLPDYRLYPEVRFPTFVEDAAAAVAWARAHAAEHGGDPSRIFVAGHSAGAHLAALLATDRRYLERVGMRPEQLSGLIGIAGPYDFLPLEDDDLKDMFGPEGNWPQSQPVTFVDGDEPPALLLHGTDDLLVWPRNSERLKARLDAAGVEVDFRRYPDIGHVRILGALRFPSLAPTREDVVRFVRERAAAAPAAP